MNLFASPTGIEDDDDYFAYLSSRDDKPKQKKLQVNVTPKKSSVGFANFEFDEFENIGEDVFNEPAEEIIDELILACENQNWETAKLLLDLCDEREVDVDVKVISNWGPMESALLFACKINWLELAQAVVDSARPSDMDMMCSFVVEDGESCLFTACAFRNEELVTLIMTNWGSRSALRKQEIFKSITMCCERDYPEIIDQLIDYNEDESLFSVDAQKGKPILFLAAELRRLSIFSVLFEHWYTLIMKRETLPSMSRSASPRANGEGGGSSDRLNAGGRGVGLARGLSVRMRNGNNNDAYEDKQEEQREAEREKNVVQYLRQQQSIINSLYTACEHNSLEIVVKIVSKLDFNDLVFPNGETPLTLAFAHHHDDVVDFLLDVLVDTSKNDKKISENLYLHFEIACNKGLYDLAMGLDELMMTTGRNKVFYLTKTLFRACKLGHYPLVESIVNKRRLNYKVSFLTYEDEMGRTPLFIACQHGHRDIAEFLIDTEASRDKKGHMLTTLTKSMYNIMSSEKKNLDEPSPKNTRFDLRGFEDGFGAMFKDFSDNNISLDGVNNMLRPTPLKRAPSSVPASASSPGPTDSPSRPREFTLMNHQSSLAVTDNPDHKRMVHKLSAHFGRYIDKADKNGVSPLLIACFEGHSEVVEMLLEKGVSTKNRILRGPEYKTLMREIARVSDRRHRKVSPLLAAACGMRSATTMDLLLKHEVTARASRSRASTMRRGTISLSTAFADLGSGSFKSTSGGQRIKTMDTVFRIAILMGSVEVVEILLLWGGETFLSDLKHNPLILACQRGNKDIVEKLHEYHANINIKTEEGSPLVVACSNKHFEVVSYLIEHKVMIGRDETLKLESIQQELNELPAGDKISAIDTLKVYATAKHQSLSFSRLMSDFLTGGDFPLRAAYLGLYDVSSYHLVQYLVKLTAYVHLAKDNNSETGLIEIYGELFAMVIECMKSECMTHIELLGAVLLQDTHSLQNKDTSDVYQALMCKMFDHGPIYVCLRYKMYSFLACGPVLRVCKKLFFAPMTPKYFFGQQRDKEVLRHESIGEHLFLFKNYDTSWLVTTLDISYRIHIRYSPISALVLEALCKTFTLVLVGIVASHEGSHFKMLAQGLTYAEYLLLIQVGSECAYETGQIIKHNWNVIRYLQSDFWSIFDLWGLGLILAWGICRLTPPSTFVIESQIGRICITLACIPLSISVLRYLLISVKLGKLVIMIFQMTNEIARFMLIFLISVFGFGILFYSFFSGVSDYDSVVHTSLSLFSAALGSFDLTVFDGHPFSRFGQVLMVLFIIWSMILLLNLVIARMTIIHDEIDDSAVDQYAYNLAYNCRKFALVNENAPVCLLPPPLNIIPCIMAPIHFSIIWRAETLRKRSVISFNGGIMDRLLGLTAATVFLPITYIQCLFKCMASFHPKRMSHYLRTFPSIVCILLFLPLDIYISTVYILLTEDWLRISLKESVFSITVPIFKILYEKIAKDENVIETENFVYAKAKSSFNLLDELHKNTTTKSGGAGGAGVTEEERLLQMEEKSRADALKGEMFTQNDRDRIFEKALAEIDKSLKKNIAGALKTKIQVNAECDALQDKLLNVVKQYLPLPSGSSSSGGVGGTGSTAEMSKETRDVIEAMTKKFDELQAEIESIRRKVE